jgi:uncharacterized protein
VLEDIVIYALKEGEKKDKHFHFSLTTNGTLFNDEIIDFIEKHAVTMVISIDGDKIAQNRNRPLSGGGDSYCRVTNNLKNWSKGKSVIQPGLRFLRSLLINWRKILNI